MTANSGANGRLDAFVDAAFAFAVTLIVVGGAGVPGSYRELEAALTATPAYAIGFALVAMFWHAHVRWRRFGGGEGNLPVLLSLLLVFLVLIYVYPLRVMALSMVAWLSEGPELRTTAAERGNLFALYGLGFAAMAATVAGLFATLPRKILPAETKAAVTGEIVIWSILAVSGLVSVTLALFPPTRLLAPWTYALLPIAIGLYVWRTDWTGEQAENEEEA
ncbi:MAG: TMEM175 family protein [Pseudomonadota bacterium]|nr:TMEM175 family protein [Pseudomonadota bacterium]